ncbi:V-set domain-containing T-cell activation inhibitor 1 isoform X2 [Sparus aurata]|uniref:V-set domain containing T cell activation inhibitor 1 n=1 Tax=Sparus aurata TaxID=8175 RepID=A0A671U2G6_SPAAU|nr:V-set domain-containing T-cell activation inhibitor 1 isoform X2 [Sparus aurata]
MASLGQIIFCSMIILIVLFSALIILILSVSLTGSGFGGSTSSVVSSNKNPIANLGEDQLLSCYVNAGQNSIINQVSVTWEKKGLTGLVYKYADGADDLTDQNPQFKARTQVFPGSLVGGNGSLLLRAVRSSDEGEYTCSISSSEGKGTVNIQLRTAAFSAPTLKFSSGALVAEARSWFPKPNITWSDYDGHVLQGSTNFTQNSAGIFTVVSRLQSVNMSDTYTYRIENNLVTALSRATITGSEVSANTYFIYAANAASSLLSLTYLGIMTSVLCIYYLT